MSDENVEVEVAEEVVSDQPTVSHEQYLELVAMRQSVLELKAQKSEVLEFVMVAQQYASQTAGLSNGVGASSAAPIPLSAQNWSNVGPTLVHK